MSSTSITKYSQVGIVAIAILFFSYILYWCAESSQLLVNFENGVTAAEASQYIGQCAFGDVIQRPAINTSAPVVDVTLDHVQRIIAERCLEWGPAPVAHLFPIDTSSDFLLSITDIKY